MKRKKKKILKKNIFALLWQKMETEKTMLIYFVLFHSSFNAVSLFLTDFSQIWISFHVKIAEEYVCPISYVDCECLSSGLFFIGRILFVFYLQLWLLEIFHANWTRSAHSAAAVFVPTQIATIFNCQKLQRKFSKSILDSVSIFRCKAIIKYINFCWFECFPSNFVRFYCIFPACGAKLCHIPGTHLKFNICVFPRICKVV